MTADPRVFSSGKRGFLFRDRFDWDGRTWGIRFDAWIMTHVSVDTTLGALAAARDYDRESTPEFSTPAPSPNSSQQREKFAKLLQMQETRAAGWHLTKSEEGVQGWFELARMRELPKGNVGSFASFELNLNSVVYLGQFHISEVRHYMPKPTAWDHSRGAKAGLPSLGKRR
jgi:hypothetical protein